MKVRGVLSDQQISRIASQLFAAVAYLHKKEVVLRYLRPQRILITKGENQSEEIDLKIADVHFMHL